MNQTTEYAKRRKELMKQVGPDGIVILNAAPVVYRNNYHEYFYRQNSDFYYLTGFKEPESVLILAPKRKEGEFILFNRKRDRDEEIWNGFRAGQEGARRDFGADQSFPIEELEKKLPELILNRKEIHCELGAAESFDKILLGAVNFIHGQVRSGIQPPLAFIDIRPTIHEMRLFKSPHEIELMRKAAKISAKAHIRAMQYCQPEMYEYELEAEMTHEMQRQGGRAHAYTPIIGSGPNSCILHYVTNDKRIKKNALVLVDAGTEYEYYASDITRTFPANGRFTGEQRAIYEIVLAAQMASIKAIKPGVSWNQIENISIKVITQGLIDLGLLKGNLEDLIETKAYFPFYMHRSGHWIGLDVHDVGRYKVDGKWRKLAPNMARTVEPGIYISADLKGVPSRFHHIGVRIEDDIIVTETGNEVLSRDVPKTIDEIESLMSS